MPRFLVELAEDCLRDGDLHRVCGKTVGVVAPDGSVKRVPTVRVEAAVWARWHRQPIARTQDAWMAPKIDVAVDAERRARA